MSKVFISYARKNQPAAEVLYSVLTEWGHDVWMDVHRLEPGRSWVRDIDAALRDSEMVVGLLTTEGLESPNVMAEWFWALENDRKLILMRLADFSREKISHKLVHLQWIDYHKDEAEGFGRLRSVVEKGKPLIEAASGSVDPLASKLAAKSRWLLGNPTVNSNRKQMLRRVHAYWIEGVLHQTLKEANQFNVGFELAPDAVLKHVDYSDCMLPADTDFGKVFKHLGAEVLILGTPGSGKTILLLQLAEQLLAKAASDDQAPIPIILNLSGWSHKREPLHEWIVNEAAMSYQVPRRVIRGWMDDEAILPLLDGLDEVLPECREACVEAMNQFHITYRGVGLGVCSRIGDYELLQSKLDFRSAILLQPLDECQVHGVTSRPELVGLQARIEKEPYLEEMSRSPYQLNLMSYAYAGKSESELCLPSNSSGEDARRTHLLDAYINRRLAENRSRRMISAQRMRSLLSWLASNMIQRGQIVFHIESLQMDWLIKFRFRWLFCYLSRLLFGAVGLGVIWSAAFLMGCAAYWIQGHLTGKPGEIADVQGTLKTSTMVVAILSILMFHLAGLTSAAFEWVRSIATSGFGVSFVRYVFGAMCITLPFGLIVGFYDVINAFWRGTSLGDEGKDLLIWTLLQALPWCLCSGLAVASKKLRFHSTGPAHVAVGLCFATLLVTFGIFYRPSNTPFNGAAAGFLWIMFAIPFAMAMGMASLFGDQIQSAERIQWRWNKRAARNWSLPWVGWCLFVIVGLAISVCRRALTGTIPPDSSASNASIEGLTTVGYVCGGQLALAAVSFLFGGLVFGFQRAESIHRRLVPNEGVFRSVRMGAWLALGFGAMGMGLTLLVAAVTWWRSDMGKGSLALALANSFPLGIVLSAFPAAIGAMLGGFDVPVKHFILRALLTIEQKIPWGLRRFLDTCAAQLMLRRVGGGYIFVHRYLLEHFARMHRDANSTVQRQH